MDMTDVIAALREEAAKLEARRALVLRALVALEETQGTAPAAAPAATKAARTVRQARPSSAPPADDDPASTSLLAALAESGEALSVSAIEARAKTGLSIVSVRRKLQALAAMKLVKQTGTGAGTRYRAA